VQPSSLSRYPFLATRCNFKPKLSYWWNLWTANIMAKASLPSVEVKVREAYATGFYCPSIICIKHAPTPHGDASQYSFTVLSASQWVSTGAVLTNFFASWSAYHDSYTIPTWYPSSPVGRGGASLDITKILRCKSSCLKMTSNSVLFCGIGVSFTALILSSLSWIPSHVILCPK